MDLKVLQKNNEPVFRAFKSKLKKDNQNEYFGTRFELSLAADFQRYNVEYKKRESPDFELHNEFGTAYIECVSTNLEETRNKDLLYKIQSSITKKAKKGYKNPKQTALFIDFTNVYFHSLKGGNALNMEKLQEALDEKLSETGFGAILALLFQQIPYEKRFGFLAKCAVSLDAAPSLTHFLSKFISADESDIVHGAVFSI